MCPYPNTDPHIHVFLKNGGGNKDQRGWKEIDPNTKGLKHKPSTWTAWVRGISLKQTCVGTEALYRLPASINHGAVTENTGWFTPSLQGYFFSFNSFLSYLAPVGCVGVFSLAVANQILYVLTQTNKQRNPLAVLVKRPVVWLQSQLDAGG